ncbi:store-operated calcium entry regulator STIMATE [Aplysia californica]|uniref:Store-operated calcium entry regulator STIMATE n=1 Tax=Aplysia californica TaxID=6500 RepID=A0ABM1VPM2_APLCA|nr:store-operated calcium entry regulator STIMATE [Aplysia californica]
MDSGDKESQLHCGHGDLRGVLGLFVQALLALLAFTSLIVKRYCEPKHSRRPWMIWFFDTSKQGVGAAVLHFANLFLSDVFKGDPCTWYFISFLLDSTVGLLVIYLGLKMSQMASHRYGWKTLYFGEYGDPPKCNAWVGQCALYILVMIIEKLLMTILVLFKFWMKVRQFIMSPITDPQLEIVLVMFIVPLIVNAIVFWVVDNFLKHSIQSAKTIYIDTAPEGRVKYFHNTDSVKCYSRIEKNDEADCDMLLSTDDDGDVRHRPTDPSERLIR